MSPRFLSMKNYTTPPKLSPGDLVRVIAPSMSLAFVSEEHRRIAERVLEEMGLRVSYGANTIEKNKDNSSSIKSRVQDFHDAFADTEVKLIICALGGYSSHEMLDHLNYDLIKANPKRLCGFSDITALSNGIFAKTGIVTYSGPCFANLAMIKGRDYIDRYFKSIMFDDHDIIIEPSKEWSEDKWYKDQKNRQFKLNPGYWHLNEGSTKGHIVGGNISTLRLLLGSQYIPSFQNCVLFIEENTATGDAEDTYEFKRFIQSLIHQPYFSSVKGLVIGRFKSKSAVNQKALTNIIAYFKELKDIPVIANVDFGHTYPFFTFPIGGKVEIEKKNITLIDN